MITQPGLFFTFSQLLNSVISAVRQVRQGINKNANVKRTFSCHGLVTLSGQS